MRRLVIRSRGRLAFVLGLAFILTLAVPPVGVVLTLWVVVSGIAHLTGDVRRWEREDAQRRYWAKVNRGSCTYGGRIAR